MDTKDDLGLYSDRLNDLKEELDYLNDSKNIDTRYEALRIIIIYLISGILWLIITDEILNYVIQDISLFGKYQSAKGIMFIVITGAVFYFIIEKRARVIGKYLETLSRNNKRLSELNEKLLAMDQELEKSHNSLLICEEGYELAIEGSNDGIWDYDFKNHTYFCSEKWMEAMGFQGGKRPYSWVKIIHPEDAKGFINSMKDYIASGSGTFESTYRAIDKDGKNHWILTRGKGNWDTEGSIIRISGSHTDITKVIELQENLRRQNELSEGIAKDASQIIVTLTTDGIITKFNSFAEKITGYRKNEVVGSSWSELFAFEQDAVCVKLALKGIKDGNSIKNYEGHIVNRDGIVLDVLWNVDALHDDKGNAAGILAIGTEITAHKAMERRNMYLAYYDSLTGVYNRRAFEEKIHEIIEEKRTNQLLNAVIFFDIDDFKSVNGVLGHSAGDMLLVKIGDLLKQNAKSPNFAARMGGDEFAIALLNYGDYKSLHDEIEHIHNSLSMLWAFEGHESRISVSMGVALYPQHGEDLKTLLRSADAAMLNIKENEKDGYVYFSDEVERRVLDKMHIISQLGEAINNDKFILNYQPQVDLFTGKMIGVEALIRWKKSEDEIICPSDFIPLAEETGQIVQIAEWVLRNVCEQIVKWKDMGYPSFKVAINLSGRQLLTKDLIDTVRQIVEDQNIDYTDLEFEITETAVMNDFNTAVAIINELRKLGASIALDDFGTGYSSLTYLRDLPIDVLKLDRQFISNINKDGNKDIIIETIIQLAHKMGLKIVAEGIETQEQLLFLKKYNCEVGQGYLFGKPAAAEKIEHMFGTSRQTVGDQVTDKG